MARTRWYAAAALAACLGQPRAAFGQDEAGGVHHRVVTEHGPVHVWHPAGLDVRTAPVVLYVHGYYVDVDQAWREHRLASQFAASGVRATFVAPEAPRSNAEAVRWTSLDALLSAVERATGSPSGGRVIAAAHSGGYRTVLAWRSSRMDAVALLDGCYRGCEQLAPWVQAEPERRLVLVGPLTRERARRVAGSVPQSRSVRDLTKDLPRLTGAERTARVLLVDTQLDHMSLVTGGAALPAVLRAVAEMIDGDPSA